MKIVDFKKILKIIPYNVKPIPDKFKLVLLIGLILILFLILGFVSDLYMKKIAVSPEIIYRQTTEGTIEIGLMKEQLSEILTLYALGLNGKSDFNRVKNLAGNTIINIATLIEIYPEDKILSEISNLMIKAIRLLESAEKEGFNWSAMKELQRIEDEIKADLVKFNASKRLRWSSTIRSYEDLSRNSQIIYLSILIICGSLICIIGYIIISYFQKIHSVSVRANNSLIKAKLSSKKGHDGRLGLNSLSDREKKILVLIAQGYDNREIARRMFMAEQTIKNYVSEIYSKLGVHGRVQASLMAIEAGLLDVQDKTNED